MTLDVGRIDSDHVAAARRGDQRRAGKRRVVLAVAVAASAVVAAPASADIYVTGLAGDASVEVESYVEGNPNIPNVDERVMIVSLTATSIRVTAREKVHPQGTCTAPADASHVDCPTVANSRVRTNLKLGADTLDASGLSHGVDVLAGDDGDDTITTGGGDDTLSVAGSGNDIATGPGADVIAGGVTTTVLRGQGGDDTIFNAGGTVEGGPGDDRMTCWAAACQGVAGGDGVDSVGFVTDGVAARVTISLDGVANDGIIGLSPAANVASDVETLRGSGDDDVLTGGAGAQRLEGLAGADELDGQGGPDVLAGGPGGDRLQGGAGEDVFDEGSDADADGPGDVLAGGPGMDAAGYGARTGALRVDADDVADDGAFPLELDNVRPDVEEVRGGSGPDELSGGPGAQRLLGGPGDDTLDGGGGADVLLGGSGEADLVDYGARSAAVAVDLDGASGDDGEAGEGDSVGADVEDVLGGQSGDVLRGNAADNLLDGGAGGDVLSGLAGTGDIVDYSGREAAVDVSLDGQMGDDGEAGEGDTVDPDVEHVWGGSGGDVLRGNGSANLLYGGVGDDQLDGGAGPDELVGAAGEDLADYASRTEPVVVRLGGPAGDDGAAGEGDTVGDDVEHIWSGTGADELTGNHADNVVDGGAGADRISGMGGFDLVDYSSRTAPLVVDLDGAPGDDGEAGERDTVVDDVEDIAGGAGPDRLTGNGAQNVIVGGPGDDLLDGAGEADALFGEDGGDRLMSRDDSADEDYCGAGPDAVVADPDDLIDADCETVDTGGPATAPATLPLPPPEPAPTATPSAPEPDGTAPHLRATAARRTTLKRLVRKGVTVRLRCSEACTVHAELRLQRRARRRPRLPHLLAHADVQLKQDVRGRLLLTPSPAARRLLGRTRIRAITLRLRLTAVDSAGNRTTLARIVTVAARR